jgi:hypothetical protein
VVLTPLYRKTEENRKGGKKEASLPWLLGGCRGGSRSFDRGLRLGIGGGGDGLFSGLVQEGPVNFGWGRRKEGEEGG